MKKLLKEGRTDFNPAKGIAEILIFVVIFSCKCLPQVPINGFCKYQAFKTDSGYYKILPLNYNNDSYTDLFFFNPAGDSAVSLDGNRNGTFGSEHKMKLTESLSDITYLWDSSNKIYAYAFISRKKSTAGIIKFNSNGYPEIESTIKFNTYPENLSTGDINEDGTRELLISGSTFDGLSIVFQEQKLREEKISEKTSFSEAIFVDLNNDGYPDIAAFEIFSNKLQFMYNNSKGVFRKVREIPFSDPINTLQSTDLDLDSYADLILTNENSIDIFYGDFASAYDDTVKINTKYAVDKLITGDFNRDGRIDIAYINRTKGILSLIFSKDDRKFFPELVYWKKNDLNDFIPYYSKFVNGIVALSSKEEFYLVSNLSSLSDEASIIAGAYPTAVSYFDKNNNSINDLCFIDGYNKTLNLLIRNNSGIPGTWFPIPLFENESEVIVNNKLPRNKTFYCFTRDKKLIEIINVDLSKYIFDRSSVYSAGKIRDLQFQESTGSLFAAFIKDKNLGVSIFSNDKGHLTDRTITAIHNNISDAALSIYSNPEVYYSTGEDTILIGNKELTGNQENRMFNTGFTNPYTVTLFAGDFINKHHSALFGFLSSQIKNDMVFFLTPGMFTVAGQSIQPGGLRIIDKNQLFFGSLKFNGPGRLCYFNPAQQSVKYLELTQRNNKLSRNLLMENVNSRSFFIKNMNTRKFHLVYIDNDRNCITIKELK